MNISEQIVQHIGARIVRKEFKPGERLWSEQELGQQFQVSRPILREALRMLSAKGLIETRPKSGTRIRQHSDWNLLDPDVMAWQYATGSHQAFLAEICEIRLMIEPQAARLAAARASSEEVDLIIERCQALQAATEMGESEISLSADLRFHDAISAAAHNDLLQRILNTLREPLLANRVVTSHHLGANCAAMSLHWAVAEAIRSQNPQAAETVTRRLVTLTTQAMQRALDTSSEGEEGGSSES